MRKRDTRLQLILAAEGLFAERGIDGVSLREINIAAKQRNTSAAHYHFGSKDALIDAIFEFRRPEIGRRRDELLDALEQGGRATDVRALVEALIMPLAAELEPSEEPRRYLEFLAHLFLTSPSQVGEILRKHQAADARLAGMMARALPQVPRRALGLRQFLMSRHVVISLSVYHRRGLQIDAPMFETYLSDMTDSVAGYLSAPVSEQTLALQRSREGEGEGSAVPAVAPSPADSE